MSDAPQTLLEAVRYFSDRKLCFERMLALKWPDGRIVCPNCGGESIGTVASRALLQCRSADCRKQFSLKVGTIFEDSPLALEKWFVAVWSITNAKNVISSCELARALGVSQKTAWFMLHRIRESHVCTDDHSSLSRPESRLVSARHFDQPGPHEPP